ncbi:MAG: prepilin-type N-terminal cleavage/methylation domain-containing protein [Candidatus Omnitrophica bacterium]|nr:prepilin-type N-terminal cleavage/methylation domain-containing protein [Candidatus Omnitrophota bacterium]MCA9436060.1 prepilin-type N-terminal cleavage/methylation domain-containing protein [Candidatus Omnitrophota bacterium]MCB9781666.1 prepilin-type N-terminal cleavage/methylation domain-containing protein [Candidatus Omnitrophota bacterium]
MKSYVKRLGPFPKGFTLIELLIVIAIILILIAIALPNFLEAQIRARLTSAKACLNTYRTANEAYYTDFGIHVPDVDGGEREKTTNLPWSNLWQMNRSINCGNVGELCSFAMLTTPIEYIQDLCYDPFLEQRNDSRAGKAYSLPEYTTYLSGSPLRKQRGETYGLRYMILSRAVDQDSDANDYEAIWFYLGAHRHHGTRYPVIYAATNGTKSDGDLVVTNRGHEGP